ncbi:hypothetical protein BGZ63DRAFT_427895 [Mariannaea sp. PMI_226]|nr:hypothetical protein BGZ63DRAFT_427895 [Mariannaea sp. PMI_226]
MTDICEKKQMPTPMPTTTTTAAGDEHANAGNAPQSSPHLDVDFASGIDTHRPNLAHMQQPISVPNRTSSEPQRHLPRDHSAQRHHNQHGAHALLPVSVTAPLPGGVANVAAVHAPPQPQRRHPTGHSSRAQSRHLANSNHLAVHDLHGHEHRNSAPLATASFPAPISPALAAPGTSMPVDWGVYGGAHHQATLHASPFEFELHGSNAMMPPMSSHGHISPTVSDHHALSYGGGMVSPSTIHSPHSHYGFGSSWEDHLGQDASTPTVTTPAGQFLSNPWTEPEELHAETDRLQDVRPKKAPRSRRTKKDSRRNSNSDSRTGPSPDATSPSSSQTSRASIASKTHSITSSSVASSSMASTSTTSSRLSKLRSASRTSKNSHSKPSDTVEERRTRASHNLVEKQYRNRLNSQFESLLNALPEQTRHGNDGEESDAAADWSDRRVSKGEVLEMARKHIQTLERERDKLEREKSELQGSLAQYRNTAGSEGSSGTPLAFNISMDDDDPYENDT